MNAKNANLSFRPLGPGGEVRYLASRPHLHARILAYAEYMAVNVAYSWALRESRKIQTNRRVRLKVLEDLLNRSKALKRIGSEWGKWLHQRDFYPDL